MKRKFGIELEITGITRSTALNALRAVGMDVRDEQYNHTTRQYWKLVQDSSVQGGFEVVSPVLEGDAGLEEAMIVAEALADAGATVNRTCGFHVHFDASGLSVDAVKTIVKRYARYEAEIDAVMPRSRRGNENQFCRSIGSVLTRAFEAASSIEELAYAQCGRYFKVNLHSYPRHGTIEFRQHSGTVNARKIASWVLFLNDFIDACVAMTAARQQPAPVADNPSLRGVQAELATMFARSGSVRLNAICERFGWQPHTARAAITRLRRAGLRISAVRRDGQTTYRLSDGLVQAPAQTQPESLWTGIRESVVTFYRHRAAVLALAA